MGGFRIHSNSSLTTEGTKLIVSGFSAAKCRVPPPPTDFRVVVCSAEKYIAL